jgi:hypothetical protein
MFGTSGANNINTTLSLDNLAIFTDFLHRCPDFHSISPNNKLLIQNLWNSILNYLQLKNLLQSKEFSVFKHLARVSTAPMALCQLLQQYAQNGPRDYHHLKLLSNYQRGFLHQMHRQLPLAQWLIPYLA